MRNLILATVIIVAQGQFRTGQVLSPYDIDDQDYEDIELTLSPGKILGKRLENLDVYRQVPYAKPPVRFEMGEEIDTFGAEILNAQSEAVSCFPGLPRNDSFSENCLTLDIYIPRGDSVKEKGILFWIHGGRYTTGYSKFYTGIEQGTVVIVTNCISQQLKRYKTI